MAEFTLKRGMLLRAVLTALLLVSVPLLLFAGGQSPTEALLRVAYREMKDKAPPKITVPPMQHRNGMVHSRAKAVAKTPQAARHAAYRKAYVQAVTQTVAPHTKNGVPPEALKELIERLDHLSAAMAELKESQARFTERKTAEGYEAEANVTQSEAELLGDVRSLGLSNYRLVVLLPETIDGERVNSPKVETELVGALEKQNFRVYDWRFVTQTKPLAALVQATLDNDKNAPTQIGDRFLANVIVVGRIEAKFSQDNEGIISYRPTANLRVMRADTGLVLLSKEFDEDEDKGFGKNRAQAARDALKKLAARVAKELPAELQKNFADYPIRVRIEGGKPERAAEVEKFLRGLNGVTEVQRIESSGGTEFRLVSHEKPAALGAQIEESPAYRLAD